MALISIRRRLTHKECEEAAARIEEWFKANPRRKVCRTEYWTIRKGNVLQQVLEQENPVE